VRAALGISKALATYAEELRRGRLGPPLQREISERTRVEVPETRRLQRLPAARPRIS